MPYAQTSTSLGALSAVGNGSWVAVPRSSNPAASDGIVSIVASAVTSGAVVAVEGRVGAGGVAAGPAKELHRVTIAANGTTILPLNDIALEAGFKPEEVRVNVVSRTDGTYTSALLTTT